MKQRICIIFLLSGIFFSSCQKSSIKPGTTITGDNKTSTGTSTVLNQVSSTAGNDSLNNVNGYLRLELAEDSIHSDNVLIEFKPSAKTTYTPTEDAPTFQGFGVVSLSSFSSDDVPLAINAIPLTKKGLSIGLKIYAKDDGVYKLDMPTIKSVPEAYDVMLMDKYRKDSLDVRHNPSGYAFNVYKTDTASFGSHRFKLVIRLR